MNSEKFQTYGVKFPTKVCAGEGSSQNLIEIIDSLHSKNVLILTDSTILKHGVLNNILGLLKENNVSFQLLDSIPPEPSMQDARNICETASAIPCDLLVAIGGGSVLDITKIIALALSNPDYTDDFLTPERTTNPPIPMVAIPTTSGTGSEATANFILLDSEQNLKIGIVYDGFLYPYVILDPVLTLTLPPGLTASTGIDALCHAIESYLSTLNNPFSEFFALKAISLITDNLMQAVEHGDDIHARGEMQLASFYAGICLTSSSTVAVHALSYPLGGTFHIPHGVSNAILLPYVMEEMLDSIEPKFAVLAKYMLPNYETIPEKNRPKAVLASLFELTKKLGIPQTLEQYNVTENDLTFLTTSALKVTRLLSRNPKPFGAEEIQRIYKKIL